MHFFDDLAHMPLSRPARRPVPVNTSIRRGASDSGFDISTGSGIDKCRNSPSSNFYMVSALKKVGVETALTVHPSAVASLLTGERAERPRFALETNRRARTISGQLRNCGAHLDGFRALDDDNGRPSFGRGGLSLAGSGFTSIRTSIPSNSLRILLSWGSFLPSKVL